MKKLTYLALFFSVFNISLIALSGCSSDSDSTITLETHKLEFKAVEGGYKTTKVISEGEWSIQQGYEDWIIPSKQETNFITVGVKDNETKATRKGVVVLTSGDDKATLTIEQSGN